MVFIKLHRKALLLGTEGVRDGALLFKYLPTSWRPYKRKPMEPKTGSEDTQGQCSITHVTAPAPLQQGASTHPLLPIADHRRHSVERLGGGPSPERGHYSIPGTIERAIHSLLIPLAGFEPLRDTKIWTPNVQNPYRTHTAIYTKPIPNLDCSYANPLPHPTKPLLHFN